MTKYDIVEETGLHLFTVRDFIEVLHREHLIYIAGWENRGRSVRMPIYRLGEEKDKPKPRNTTPAERQKKWRDGRNARLLTQTINAIAKP